MKNVEIVDFELKHFQIMDMRDHESAFMDDINILPEVSIEAKTAFVDGEIYSTWGIIKEDDGHYLWQIPAKVLTENTMVYARRAVRLIRDMVKRYECSYTFCLDDELHSTWMRFIGFKPNYDNQFEHEGVNYLMYEAK